MSKDKATSDLEPYITRPAKAVARHMIGVTYNDHVRITRLATDLNTSNGRVVAALLDYYDETE